MSGIRTMASWLGTVIILMSWLGTASAASAECASVVSQPVFLSYNPLTAGAKTTDFLVTVTNNSCGPAVVINYGIASGEVSSEGNVSSLLPGLPISYSASIFRSGSPSSGILLNSASSSLFKSPVVLSNGESDSAIYTFLIDERQALPADSLNPHFMIFAYGAGQVTNNEQAASVTITSGFMMTVAGAGGSGLLDFGVLEANEPVQSINIHAQATGAYSVTLASEQNGVLRNTATGAGSYTVPYAVTLGGTLINALTPYQAATASGTILLPQGTAILPLAIDLDTSGVSGLRAGIYRDILTLTISAEL